MNKNKTLSRMKQMVLEAVMMAFAVPIHAQHISGTWSGALDVGGMPLPLVVHLANDSTCTIDSPDQQAMGIEGRVAFVSADSVCLKFPKLMATYAARLRQGELHGTFVQGLQGLPLTLKPGEYQRNRPQTPVGPFPYKTEEVTFSNELAGATLAGTLTLPTGYRAKHPCPVVLMVTGSGQQNRDEELFGHKPFAVIADYLARHGVASLRYDDRGFGLSTGGDAANATTKDLADDAAAGISWLRSRGGFSRIGLLGHSEGGAIAFMLGARGMLDFAVSMAGPGIKGDSILRYQLHVPEGKSLESALPQRMARLPWVQFFIGYDPSADISATHCPVLALNGEKDTQVLCAPNLGAIRRLLPQNQQNSIIEYAGLNHLFQHCLTGDGKEYATIEETISPDVLRDIIEWINNLK